MIKKPSRKPKSQATKRVRKPAREARTSPKRQPASAAPPDIIPPLVAAGAQALELTIDPAWRDAVASNLRLILRHAALIDDFELPDDAEPAPIFSA
jgi:Protein of unknown function (DUF4089)